MSGPCARPECGGVVHTDPWGTSVQCPHAEPVLEDTGRRCPRCDCPDGHEQCEHCKTCPHARPSKTAEFATAVGCAVLHRDARGNVIPCPDRAPVSEGPPCSEVAGCDGRCCDTRDKDEELRRANQAIERILTDLNEARAAIECVRMLHRPADYRGLAICVACSAYDGSTCDNSPVGYEYCATLKALAGPEAP